MPRSPKASRVLSVYNRSTAGSSNATNLLVFYIYQHGFQYFRLGFAAAIAVVMFGLVYAVTALVSLWFNR